MSTAQALHTGVLLKSKPQKIVVDCGAMHHMFHSKDVFTSLAKDTKLPVTTGESSSNLITKGIGTASVLSNKQCLTFPNSLFVPKLNCNLASLLKLFDKELIITRHKSLFSLTTEGKEFLHGEIENSLMKVDDHLPTSHQTTVNVNPWHKRLGHTCNLNKAHPLTFKDHFEPAHLPLDCIYIDLVGQISPPSISGYRYFLIIVDPATSFKIIWFLKNKSDAFHKFTVTQRLMETQHNPPLKKLVSDQAGELLNSQMNAVFYTAFLQPTPEHNGIAKRANCTTLEKTQCMLNSTKLPNSYWAEAVSTASLLSNSVPTASRHNHLPHTLWTGLPPRIKKLRVFSCQAIVMTPKEHQDSKLGPTGVEGSLLGYKNNNSAYQILCLLDRKILISRHVRFNESVFPQLKQQGNDLLPLNLPLSCTLDPCVFYQGKDSPLWLYIHVDNIAIFGREVDFLKWQITAEFEIKDIGQADLMLGIKITQKEGSITLYQQHFAESLLELYGMGSSQPASTLLIPNCHLEPATVNEVEKFRALGINYRSAIGSINYLSTSTCPNLSFTVSTLSHFLENPGIKHWHGFLHVLHYLNGSQDLGLSYSRKGVAGIVAYSDADWGNCLLTCRLVTGYLACFNQCLIIWKTRKQLTVSLSMAEAEYKSLCDLTSELLWLSQWCQEAGLVSCNTPDPFHGDNQACINTANGNSNVNAKRMKHIDIQLHFAKECIKSEKIRLVYTPTKDMLADFLTKSVPKPSLSQALDALGVFGLGVRGVLKINYD
ncbi:hypothetical protein O181_007712 [Austropuccinia psidii MF-1]|uniref:Integrase catalytic domain-containing protein n=1 Tax=Austropuccinia psidii MF-1 TaxID=1389203 RepID=A0A9Q3GIR5_9BASI|nr:hypothetical protein [Austropuccinia psidii MF-1]